MSIKVMTRVWEYSKSTGSELLLLLAMADAANDDGICWPSLATLAGKARMSRRYVSKLLIELVESGQVERVGRSGEQYKYSTRYKIVVNPSTTEPQFTSEPQFPNYGTPVPKTSEPQFTQSVINPSLNVNSTTPESPADKHRKSTLEAMAKGQAIHDDLTRIVHDTYMVNPIWRQKNYQELEKFLRLHTEDEIRTHGIWWWKTDWRGIKGQAPTPAQIIETWPQAFKPEPVHQGEVYR